MNKGNLGLDFCLRDSCLARLSQELVATCTITRTSLSSVAQRKRERESGMVERELDTSSVASKCGFFEPTPVQPSPAFSADANQWVWATGNSSPSCPSIRSIAISHDQHIVFLGVSTRKNRQPLAQG